MGHPAAVVTHGGDVTASLLLGGTMYALFEIAPIFIRRRERPAHAHVVLWERSLCERSRSLARPDAHTQRVQKSLYVITTDIGVDADGAAIR